MPKVWLADSRSVRLFIDIERQSVTFGYLDAREKGQEFNGYLITLTEVQWNEISQLWNDHRQGKPLPDKAGYLKDQ